MAVIKIKYVGAYDPSVFAFTDPAFEIRVKQTVDVMVLMLAQPRKASAKSASTSISDISTGNKYMIQYYRA